MRHCDIGRDDWFVLRHGGLSCTIFSMPGNGGEWDMVAYDESNKDRFGARAEVTVATVYADDSVEFTAAWARVARAA